MDLEPQQFGKWLVAAGAVFIIVGLLMMAFGRLGLFHLPGDFQFRGRNWQFYLPLASSVILSILLTLVFWLISHFRR